MHEHDVSTAGSLPGINAEDVLACFSRDVLLQAVRKSVFRVEERKQLLQGLAVLVGRDPILGRALRGQLKILCQSLLDKLRSSKDAVLEDDIPYVVELQEHFQSGAEAPQRSASQMGDSPHWDGHYAAASDPQHTSDQTNGEADTAPIVVDVEIDDDDDDDDDDVEPSTEDKPEVGHTAGSMVGGYPTTDDEHDRLPLHKDDLS